MTYQVYITVTGSRQGAFKGGSVDRGREGKIKALAVSYGVNIPHETANGQATGRRVHKPVTFSIEWESCSPQFFTAAFTSELLSSIVIEYYGAGRDGLAKIDHTIKLKNSSILEINEGYATIVNGEADGRDIQTVAVTFQSIEITSNTGGTSALDDVRVTA